MQLPYRLIRRHYHQCNWLYIHRYRYYELQEPIIDDLMWDKGLKVLEALEDLYPILRHPWSVTRTVEYPSPEDKSLMTLTWNAYLTILNVNEEQLFKMWYQEVLN